MVKKIFGITLFLLLALFSFGCEKESSEVEFEHFSPGSSYLVGIQAKEFQTCARFFFDPEGSFHLLHEDPSSPLFGMEEVFTENEVKSYFHEMELHTASYNGGVGTVYRAIRLIREEEPKKIIEKEDFITHIYSDGCLSFEFTFSAIDFTPINITGMENSSDFVINFNRDA